MDEKQFHLWPISGLAEGGGLEWWYWGKGYLFVELSKGDVIPYSFIP